MAKVRRLRNGLDKASRSRRRAALTRSTRSSAPSTRWPVLRPLRLQGRRPRRRQGGRIFCCAHCAKKAGASGLKDRAVAPAGRARGHPTALKGSSERHRPAFSCRLRAGSRAATGFSRWCANPAPLPSASPKANRPVRPQQQLLPGAAAVAPRPWSGASSAARARNCTRTCRRLGRCTAGR